MGIQANNTLKNKRRRNILLATLIPIGVIVGLVIAFFAVLIINQEYRLDNASKLAKRKFHMDQVIWCDFVNDNCKLYSGPWNNLIVGIKKGEEIAVIVPLKIDKSRKPVKIDWMFDISLTEISERVTEVGIPSVLADGYLTICDYSRGIKESATEIGIDGDELLQRLDIGAIFEYIYEDDNGSYHCLITQENHEFKVYRHNKQTEELDVLTI